MKQSYTHSGRKMFERHNPELGLVVVMGDGGFSQHSDKTERKRRRRTIAVRTEFPCNIDFPRTIPLHNLHIRRVKHIWAPLYISHCWQKFNAESQMYDVVGGVPYPQTNPDRSTSTSSGKSLFWDDSPPNHPQPPTGSLRLYPPLPTGKAIDFRDAVPCNISTSVLRYSQKTYCITNLFQTELTKGRY